MYDTGSTMRSLRLVALVALVALLGFAAARWRAQERRRRDWAAVTGTVVAERDGGHGAGGGTLYDKVIEFRTEDGRPISGTPLNGSTLGTPVVGRPVPVWYDRRDPMRFEACVHWTDRAGSFALLGAALAAVLLVVSWLP